MSSPEIGLISGLDTKGMIKTCFTPSLASYSLKDKGLECRKMEMSLYTAFQLSTLKDIITSPPILLINTIGRNQHMIRK